MERFRVLILVLASDTDPIYCAFQAAWRRISHPRADVYFLKAHPNLQGDDFVYGDTVFIKCEESLATVYEKQLRAFRLLQPSLAQYAFVFRTNLSSFVDIPLYLAACTKLARTGVYSGVIGTHDGISFASGSGFTITPDLVQRLVDETPPEVFVDDVSIGKAMMSWGVPILPAPRIDILDGGIFLHRVQDQPDVFHVRIKTRDRLSDAQTLLRLARGEQRIPGRT